LEAAATLKDSYFFEKKEILEKKNFFHSLREIQKKQMVWTRRKTRGKGRGGEIAVGGSMAEPGGG